MNKKIDSKSDCEKLWNQLLKFKAERGRIYRGIEDAKFRLYSSGQRYYMQKNIVYGGYQYEDFIEQNIQFTKELKNPLLEKYVNQDNCLTYLSIMQHHRIPSPLLDFTRNPFIALYFATNSQQANSSNEIEGYSSLYFVNSEYWSIKYAYQDWFSQWILNNTPGHINYHDLKYVPFLLMSDSETKFQIVNNKNIIHQEGLFVYNSHPHVPFAEQFKLTINVLKSRKLIHEDTKPELLTCWNINKELNSYLRQRLALEMNITEKFIFPEINNLNEEIEAKWLLIRQKNEGFKRIDYLTSIGMQEMF